ncbi:MAG: filamentous hemagglutinin N-terminal domain-containing protein [Cyanobacteria bacterium J06633_23]
MLTNRLAIANSMIYKFSYVLLAAIPLWLPSSHGTASAQIQVETSPSASPSTAAAATTTAIQPATSETTIDRQANQLNILGGQSSGGSEPNLIHQFQQFDLGADDAANFVVSPDVANVISLINGLQPSSIDGLLKITSNNSDIDSSANLFLVNPAGIIFGEDARLSLPANLTATTASGLLFEDTYLLSINGSVSEVELTTTGDTSSASTLTPLFNGSTGLISAASASPTVNDLTGAPSGYLLLAAPANSAALEPLSTELPYGSIKNQGDLQVASPSTITLIGQYIQNDGSLVAPGGDVNLIATSGETLLRLTQPGNLLSLDVIPADTLAALSSGDEQAATALPTTELAQLLTGGNEPSATQIEVSPDGSQTLTSTPPLTPTPGTVLVRGTVDVSDNTPADQLGSPGQVTMLGDQINLVGGKIYADGVGQAGTLSIGGMPIEDGFSAGYVLVDRNSTLQANSETDTGGSIHIWANDTVRFYGTATATGADSLLDGTVTIDAGNVLDIRQPTAR